MSIYLYAIFVGQFYTGDYCIPQIVQCPPQVYYQEEIKPKIHDHIHMDKEHVKSEQYVTVREPNGKLVRAPVINGYLPRIRHQYKDGYDIRHFYYDAKFLHNGEEYINYVRVKDEDKQKTNVHEPTPLPAPPILETPPNPDPELPPSPSLLENEPQDNETNLFKDLE